MITFEVLKITWDELETMGYASVTDYCRYLVSEYELYQMGGGPGKLKEVRLPDRIEIYRGEMLCMTVTDVVEAAKLEPADGGFVKYRPPQVKRRNAGVPKPTGAFLEGVR